MTPSFTIEFADGSTRTIPLLPKVIVAAHPGKQSVEFRETDKGWLLYVTERTLAGKKLKGITFTNPPHDDPSRV